MNLTAAQTDRAIGVLVAGAAGDALGAGYEFGCASFTGTAQMIGGGLGNFAPGEWTDDTAQAYAIAQVAASGADLRSSEALDAIAAGFDRWWRAGPPDIGILTRQVLSALPAHPTAAAMRAAADTVHQRTGRTAGNGSLMRTAPVTLAHLDDPDALVEAAVAVAELTHADPVGGQACALWCLGIRHAVLTGELPDLHAWVEHLPADAHEFWHSTLHDAETNEPGTFTPNGYVVSALQAAWSAIVHTPVPQHDPALGTFACLHLQDALNAAIGIGDDTDTVAAIAGAMLGARWGVSAVPWRWRRILHGWDAANARTLEQCAVLAVRGGHPDSQGWPTVERLSYEGNEGYGARAVHPLDAGVLLTGAQALDDLPEQVDAVVSLCRVGTAQVPAGLAHAEFRLLDRDDADNPNIDFVLSDAAEAVSTLRDEGRTVLLHCAAAQSRTPTVAARYAQLRGHGLDEALTQIQAALPHSRPRDAFRAALERAQGSAPHPA
ncbi:ADP-ribosylglycohydrolase family protein [Dermacoccaceae bacterium W4C1]